MRKSQENTIEKPKVRKSVDNSLKAVWTGHIWSQVFRRDIAVAWLAEIVPNPKLDDSVKFSDLTLLEETTLVNCGYRYKTYKDCNSFEERLSLTKTTHSCCHAPSTLHSICRHLKRSNFLNREPPSSLTGIDISSPHRRVHFCPKDIDPCHS